MRYVKALSASMVLILVSLVFFPAVTGEIGSVKYVPVDILSPQPDTAKGREYEDLDLSYTDRTNARKGGALELEKIPSYQLLQRTPKDCNFTQIIEHPTDGYALILSTKSTQDETGVWEYEGPGPIYRYYFSTGAFDQVYDGLTGAARTLAFHPTKDYALIAYGDTNFETNGILKLNTNTWAATKVLFEYQNPPGTMQETNVITFTENGGYAYLGQYCRFMAVYSDSTGKITVLDDDDGYLTREYIVDGVWDEYQNAKDDHDTWMMDTEVLNPPTDPDSALYGYYHGIRSVGEFSVLGWVAVGILAVLTVVGVILVVVGTVASGGVLTPLAFALIALGAAAFATLIGMSVVSLMDGETNLGGMDDLIRNIWRRPITDMEIITESEGAGVERLIAGVDYIAIANQTPPRGITKDGTKGKSACYSHSEYTHSLNMDGPGYLADDNVIGNNEAYLSIAEYDGKYYIFGNEVNLDVKKVGEKYELVDATSKPIYRIFDPSDRSLSPAYYPSFGDVDDGVDTWALTNAFSLGDQIILSAIGATGDGETIAYEPYTVGFKGAPGDNTPVLDEDDDPFIIMDMLQYPGSSTSALVAGSDGLYLYREEKYYSYGNATLKTPRDEEINIGVVNLEWTDNTGDVANSAVYANVSVDGGNTWYPAENGVDVVILQKVGLTEYNSKDMSRFMYRFHLHGDSSTTPRVYDIRYNLTRMTAPKYTFEAVDQEWEETAHGNGMVVTFELNWLGALNSEIVADTRFEVNYGDGISGALNVDNRTGYGTDTHMYLRPGRYVAWARGYFVFASGGRNYNFEDNVSDSFHVENLAPVPIITYLGEQDAIVKIKKDQKKVVSANSSFDSDGSITAYQWQGWDDHGNLATDSYVTLEYNNVLASADVPIIKTLTLTVWDDGEKGGSGGLYATTEITVHLFYNCSTPTVRGELDVPTTVPGPVPTYKIQYNNTVKATSVSFDDVDLNDNIEKSWIRILKDGVDKTNSLLSSDESVGNGVWSFIPRLDDIGTYTIQMKARDDSNKGNMSLTGYETVAILIIQPAPITGDWLISEDMSISNWKLELSGDIRIGEGYDVTFDSVEVIFNNNDAANVLIGLFISESASLTTTDCTFRSGYYYKPHGDLANVTAIERYEYWMCDVMGTLTDTGSLYQYLGFQAKVRGTWHECSGITFNKATGLSDNYGAGSFEDTVFEYSIAHAVSTRSVNRISFKNCAFRYTNDEQWLEPDLTTYVDQFDRTVISHVYLFQSSNALLDDCSFGRIGKSSEEGYGVYAYRATVGVQECYFDDVIGCGIWSEGSELTVEDCNIFYSRNGIVVYDGEWEIHDNTIVGRRKSDNEGITIIDTSVNGEIYNNTVKGFDKGLYASIGAKTLSIYGILFDDCRAYVDTTGQVKVYNYIKVRILDQGLPYEDGKVTVFTGSTIVWDGETNSNGETPWLCILDRDYRGEDYTPRNNSVQVRVPGMQAGWRIDSSTTGTVLVYEVREQIPEEKDKTGISWYSRKSGDGWYALGSFWWIILGFVLLAGISFGVFLYNIGRTDEAIYSIISGIGLSLLLLFVANSWWWAVGITGVFLAILAYMILESTGVISKITG